MGNSRRQSVKAADAHQYRGLGVVQNASHHLMSLSFLFTFLELEMQYPSLIITTRVNFVFAISTGSDDNSKS